MDDLLARQMRRERPNRRRPLGLRRRALALIDGSSFGFELLERELQLGDLLDKLLGRPAELHPLQPGDLDAQRLDQEIACGKLGAGVDKSGVALGQKRLQGGNPLVPIV